MAVKTERSWRGVEAVHRSDGGGEVMGGGNQDTPRLLASATESWIVVLLHGGGRQVGCGDGTDMRMDVKNLVLYVSRVRSL